jgi:RNA polymerase primary sigma factor
MRKIKSDKLGQLLMQLRFTPESKRRAELEAAERLYALVQEDKQYPFDFVCFHITGYHPKGELDQQLTNGRDLLDDLQVFIAKLSGRLATPVDQEHEPVYAIEDLAKKFEVSTKTVNRWRKRGLLTRKFIFADGAHRFGCLASVVERFVQENPDLVAKAGRFRRLTDAQRQQAVRQARSLASRTTMSRHQIIRQVAEKLGVATETVRYTLQQYEQKHADKPIFCRPVGRIQPAQAAELFRLHKQGTGIQDLMKRFDRSRATVYRVVNQRRALALLARKIEFVSSDEFLREGAKEKILGQPPAPDQLEPQRHIEPFDLVGENLLPEYMQVLKTTPVLTREQETDLPVQLPEAPGGKRAARHQAVSRLGRPAGDARRVPGPGRGNPQAPGRG